MITWEWVIGAGIITILVLTIISRILKMTIRELLGAVRDFLVGAKDGGEEQFVNFYE